MVKGTDDLIRLLWRQGGVLVDRNEGHEFKLHASRRDLPRSPIKIRFDDVSDQVIAQTAVLLAQLAEEHGLTFDTVIGVPNGAKRLAYAFAAIVPGVTVMEMLKLPNGDMDVTEGTWSTIDLNIEPRVLLIENVISTCASALVAARALALIAPCIVGLVSAGTWEVGGERAFKHSVGTPAVSLFTGVRVAEIGADLGLLSPELLYRAQDCVCTWQAAGLA